MTRRALIVGFFILLSLALASQAVAAPAVSWLYVQHRTYQDGRELNRLSFGFKDASSNAPLLGDNLTSVTLHDPNGKEVAVPKPIFFPAYTAIDGQYDDKTGIWSYGEPYQIAEYYADLEQELIVGRYHLIVVFADTLVDATFNYTGAVDLPIVPASSIKSTLDASGNLISSWAVSYELSKSNPSLATFARVTIDIKKNGEIIGCIYYRVPTHLGRLFLPKALVDTIKGIGGTNYAISVMLRTNDNSNRAYSKSRKLVL